MPAPAAAGGGALRWRGRSLVSGGREGGKEGGNGGRKGGGREGGREGRASYNDKCVT